jgi:hypothetical protein
MVGKNPEHVRNEGGKNIRKIIQAFLMPYFLRSTVFDNVSAPYPH